MDVDLNELESKLLTRYQENYTVEGHPLGTYPYAPPIPFVGHEYGSARRPKVLVYASAENLTYTRKRPVEVWLEFPNQMVRSRSQHAEKTRTDGASHWVHIWPVDNGSLLRIARHILSRLHPHVAFADNSARSFLDQIAVANLGKYSLLARSNKDYAGREDVFKWSMGYIRSDVDVLKPEVIIAPRTILATLQQLGYDFKEELPGCVVIPIFQVSPQAINIHLKRCLQVATNPKREEKWSRWPMLTKAINTDLYFQWIDEFIEDNRVLSSTPL